MISRRQMIGTTLIGLGGVAYATCIEPAWLDKVHISLRLPRLARAFSGYKLIQISDLHIDAWLGTKRLRQIVDLINSFTPDAIVITGDFATEIEPPLQRAIAAELSRLQPKDVTAAILGNHDYWCDPAIVREMLQASGIVDVSNSFHSLQRQDKWLHIAGVDDIWENQQRLDLVLENLPAEGAAILLAHEPDFADVTAATERFDLQLSGHTHGGQVKIPGIGAPILPNMGKKYPEGLYRVHGMYHYTNRGIGMIRPAVRFNCRPEITIFTLKA